MKKQTVYTINTIDEVKEIFHYIGAIGVFDAHHHAAIYVSLELYWKLVNYSWYKFRPESFYPDKLQVGSKTISFKLNSKELEGLSWKLNFG